jgi:predicted mannosyl-3-phosphoglycerate phosphatase (HAD superfamily)
MNARAHALVDTLLDNLGELPGASAMSVHARQAWVIVLITASSDEAVTALGEELGLGETEVTIAAKRWWQRASSEGRRGARTLRVVVAGPAHPGPPPRGDAGEASS